MLGRVKSGRVRRNAIYFRPALASALFRLLDLVSTVPGTAKPVNSQLQLSQRRLYRQKIFDKVGVGR